MNTSSNSSLSGRKKELEWGAMPVGITDLIVQFVGSVDLCGYLPMVAKTFRHWVSQHTFEWFCKRIFISQTQRNKMKIENWRTWSNMLIHRPRLRLNGMYALRTLFSKAPCNDRFWEGKNLQSIEYYYYRHIRFFDNGKLLYAHNTIDPFAMIASMGGGVAIPKKLTFGDYIVRGSLVYIKVRLHYSVMFFILKICDAPQGKHNHLAMVNHFSITLNQETAYQDKLHRQLRDQADAHERLHLLELQAREIEAWQVGLSLEEAGEVSFAQFPLDRMRLPPEQTATSYYEAMVRSLPSISIEQFEELKDISISYSLPMWEVFEFYRCWHWVG